MALTDEQLTRMRAVQASMAIEGHEVSDEQARAWTEQYLADGRADKVGAVRIGDRMSYVAMRAEGRWPRGIHTGVSRARRATCKIRRLANGP